MAWATHYTKKNTNVFCIPIFFPLQNGFFRFIEIHLVIQFWESATTRTRRRHHRFNMLGEWTCVVDIQVIWKNEWRKHMYNLRVNFVISTLVYFFVLFHWINRLVNSLFYFHGKLFSTLQSQTVQSDLKGFAIRFSHHLMISSCNEAHECVYAWNNCIQKLIQDFCL